MTTNEVGISNSTAIEKAEELNNSALLDVHCWSSYPEVNAAVDLIYDEMHMMEGFNGRPTARKRHIKVVILDLYVKWLTDPTMYVSYRRGSDAYQRGRYNKLHISKSTPLIVDDLLSLGYIVNIMGHYGRDGIHASHYSRMRSTDRLTSLFNDLQINENMIEKAPNTECIILRDIDVHGRKIDIDYEDNDQANQWRDDLYNYNNLLRVTHIGIPDYPEEGIPTRSKNNITIKLNKHNKFVRRVFNNGSWKDGGRYYGGWWQGIPEEWRIRIRINGLPTSEVDYSGLHIVLLYQLKGIDYWMDIGSDPYQIPELEQSSRMRDILKQILLASINSKDRESTRKAIQKEINFDKGSYGWIQEESIDIDDIITLFEEQHSPIQEYFSTGYGVKLQNLDSRIAEHVINSLTSDGIPSLCIHDSFIVTLDNRDRLHELMINGFRVIQEEYSIDPKVKGLDTIGWTDLLNDRDRFIDNIIKFKYDHPEYSREIDEANSKEIEYYNNNL
jgi:hypothetical protein